MRSLLAGLAAFLTFGLPGGSLLAQATYPPRFEDARSETYRTVGGVELRLWVFGQTDSAAPKPAILFFFGGGWKSGSPSQFEPQARFLAQRGMIALVADYRVQSRHGVKVVDCVTDAKAALAWVRANAKRLGIDPARIAAAGGSAGGHLAASTGTLAGFGSEERPNALILFNPACVLAPIEGWKPRGFEASADLPRLGAEPRTLSPAHHIGPHTPPTLILHGKADTTVPYESSAAFDAAMRRAGRPSKLVGYDGAGHGFFNRGEGYRRTLTEADAFLVSLGWLKP